MPKISAPTLAEHRSRQRAALLGAAKEVALSDGHQAVTFAAVATRAGLARNSVYEYFESPQDLLGSLVLQHMEDWTARVSAAMSEAHGPEAKVLAFTSTGLRHMTADQPLARVLAEMPLPDRYRAPMVALVADMVRPLATALAELGVRDPDAAAVYLQGSMRAAARRVDAGHASLDDEVRTLQEFALAAITGLHRARRPSA